MDTVAACLIHRLTAANVGEKLLFCCLAEKDRRLLRLRQHFSTTAHRYARTYRVLPSLQGRQHTVCTGVTVRRGGEVLTEAEETAVFFRAATKEELLSYIRSGEPMDKAGSYGIQGLGSLLVEKIDGDFFNVMGLPLLRLSRMLAQFGVKLL